ncbi:tetraspanin-33-like [Halichondria panicea]|uniref:tetraspanin-33-like n=1 Tax=Halichondria panicea TaxID=6063 RepID=UPI00312B6B12
MAARVCNLVIKFLLFLTNIILWLLGVVILAIGIYVQVETGFSDLSLGSVLTSPAIVLIIIGAVLFVVGFCGCFGALLELFPLLLIYAIILSIILLAEVGVVVYAFVQSREFSATFESLLENYIVNYYNDVNLRNLVDRIQGQLLLCCGVTGPNDWQANAYFNCSSPAFQRCSVPFSCCELTDGEVINVQCGYGTLDTSNPDSMLGIYQIGCLSTVEGLFSNNLYVVGGVGVGLLVFQILNILLASGLAVDVYRENKEIKAIKKQDKQEKKAHKQREQGKEKV